jgi:putative endonuclease
MSLRGEAVAIPFQKKQYYVYIMTNKINTVLYTGVTSNLKKRIWEHKEKVIDGFRKCHIKRKANKSRFKD